MKRLILLLILAVCVQSVFATNLTVYDWADKGTPDWGYRYLEYMLVSNPNAQHIFLSSMPLNSVNIREYLNDYSGSKRADTYAAVLSKTLDFEQGKTPRMLFYRYDDVIFSLGGHVQTRAGYGSLSDESSFDGYSQFGLVSDLLLGDKITVRSKIDIVRPLGDEIDGIEPYRRSEDENAPPSGYAEWGDMLGKAEEAYVNFDLSYFNIQVGRDNVRWGPGYYSALTVSENPPGFDMLKVYGDIGPIRFTYFSAVLDGAYEKFISAHRLDWRVSNRLYLGASESILYAEQGFQPKYLNPLTIYYLEQWNSHDLDNIFISIDGRFIPIDGYELYGEIVVDDYQYQSFPEGAPNKVGYLGGVYATDILAEGLDIRGEYCRINRWTYTHRYERNRYMHYNDIIGSPLGPDAFYAKGEVSYDIASKFKVYLGGGAEQHGEGTITESWENSGSDSSISPDEDRIDGKNNPFPYGIVESTVFGKAGFESVHIWNGLNIAGDVYYGRISNAGNVEDEESTHWYGALDIRYDL